MATIGTSKFGTAHFGEVDVPAHRTQNISGDILLWENISQNIDGDILLSENVSQNVSGDILVSENIDQNILGDILLWGNVTQNIDGDILLSENIDQNISGDILVSENIDQNISGDILVSEHFDQNVDGDILTSENVDQNIIGDIIVYKSPYYYINDVDFTQYIYDVKRFGFEKKLQKLLYPNSVEYETLDKGNEPLGYSFIIRTTLRETMNSFVKTLRSTSPTTFYPGTSDLYYKIDHVDAIPEVDERKFVNVMKCKVYCETPYRYADDEVDYTAIDEALPYTSSTITNYGHFASSLYTLEIEGIYESASHLTNVKLYIMNGVTEESELDICDQVNTEEVLLLDDDGLLTCSYDDDYSSSTRFDQDATATGCAVSAGKVVMGNSDNFYYIFYGPGILNDNMQLVADISDIVGDPLIQYSTDGITWNTSVAASQISSGSQTYYLSGTKKHGNVYVRFICDAGDSMNVNSVAFLGIRDLTTSDDLPTIDIDETRTVKITGDGSSKANIELVFRYRMWPI